MATKTQMNPTNPATRYHRQEILPQIGMSGQKKIGQSRVLLIGVGALGSVIAELLTRAGVGTLRIVDRDLVEFNNLQRQHLFDQKDAELETPKTIAAARRLSNINSGIHVEPLVADANVGNIESLSRIDDKPVDLILDGTDNVGTRYVINDLAVRDGIAWVHGACVGTTGRVMGIWPGKTACLRCLYPTPPNTHELPTCDTAGVLGPAATATGALQAALALRFIVEGPPGTASLTALDVWTHKFGGLQSAAAPQPDCPCCVGRQFPFLSTLAEDFTTTLCGRGAVQVHVAGRRMEIPLAAMAERLSQVGAVRTNAYFLRCRLNDQSGIELTLFPDGRLLVHGTTDVLRARSLYARYIGS
jgi:molybdopterin/thiamine biosynthesis adenylyltransferase